MIGQILEYNKSAVNSIDCNGCSPLVLAIVKPDKKIALRLILLGVHINTKRSRSVLG
jgi:hypothetical protein